MKKLLSFLIMFTLVFSVFAEKFDFVPECSAKVDNHEWIEHKAYSLCYNEDSEQPEFTVFEMTKSEAKKLGSAPRKNNFRADSAVSTGSAALSDYKGSGYSRGHMVANGDMNYSAETASETFYLSNMSPQIQTMNGGAWLAVENYTQEFLVTDGAKYKSVYIYNIPLVNKDYPEIGHIGKNKVSIPVGYFKVMYIPEADEFMCWYVAQNCKDGNNKPSNAKNYLTSLELVEKQSGIYFSFSKKSTKSKNTYTPPVVEKEEVVESIIKDEEIYYLENVKSGMAIEMFGADLKDIFSEKDLNDSLLYNVVLEYKGSNYTVEDEKHVTQKEEIEKLDSVLTSAQEKQLAKVLVKHKIIKDEKAAYSINYQYVFKAGINAKHLKQEAEWDNSDLDRACASILRRLNIITGDTYFKGAYYEIFLAGYKSK